MTSRPARVLLVDDDPGLLRLLNIRLSGAGYDVCAVDGGKEALRAASQARPDAVITDLRMDDLDGLQLLRELSRRWPGLPIILITAHGTIPDAISATQEGAVAFLTKPIDKDELLAALERSLKLSGVKDADESWRSHLVCRSQAMEHLLQQAKRVGRTTSSVLIYGQSGTGKELLARAIHAASSRKGEFVALNCGAIPRDLLESELFGHTKGSFTGATSDRTGLFEIANGGTLFLDEIGDMPLSLQVKLLRVLQDQKVLPVGSNRPVNVDVRVISATHRNLQERLANGEFREDLYYRLHVVELRVPTLAERREDIPVLVAHKLALLDGPSAVKHTMSPAAMEILLSAEWPGNVRQLFNVVEKTVALSPTRVIGPRLVRDALGDREAAVPSFSEARHDFTRQYLTQLLELSGGNVSKAARLAKRNRTDFYKLLARHHIDPTQFKA